MPFIHPPNFKPTRLFSMKTTSYLLLALVVCNFRLDAADPPVSEVLKEWPQGGGFAIVVGTPEE